MKRYLLLLLLLLLLPMINAEQFVANRLADIRYSVRLDGSPVNALCNITVLNPRSTVIVPFLAMSYDATTQQHNYTIPAENVSIIGDYCYDITCSASGQNATEHDCITVTPAGQEVTSGQAIMFIFMLILCVSLFSLLVYGSFKIESGNKKNEFDEVVGINYKKYLKYFMWFVSYLSLIFIVYLGFNISFAYLYIPFLEKIYLIVWQFLMLSVYLAIPMYLLYNVVVYINDRRIIGLLERNLPIT